MHRPGHAEDNGESVYSMDRRKYLSTLAAGAALGTVAVGLASCVDTTTTDHDHDVTGRNLWGYLRIFPSEVTQVSKADPELLKTQSTIRIPYYNNTGVDLIKNPVVGFTLLTIGCPAKFAIAINLTPSDPHDETDPPHDKIVERNQRMDRDLLGMRYEALPWEGQDNTPCPEKPQTK